MELGKVCTGCQKLIDASAPLGLCPQCLVRSGFFTDQQPKPHSPDTGHVAISVEDLRAYFPMLEILEMIGQGGMGSVYKARQPRLNRLVALKVLSHRNDTDARFAERFQREAQALARMNHPNIVTVHDFGEQDGLFYLVMEYVDGMNLRQLEQAGKLSPEEALAIVPPICDALQYAHQQGIVHRDIKPENILVDKDGRVKIADFGIARILADNHTGQPLTGDKQVIGTPHYMAPEQVEKPATVDHRADIYSLGVVFYEMLTGELPIGRFAPPSKMVQIDVRLDEIVLRALEKEPKLRYQQVSEIRTQVETLTPQRTGDSIGSGTLLDVPPATPRLLLVGASLLSLGSFVFMMVAASSGPNWDNHPIGLPLTFGGGDTADFCALLSFTLAVVFAWVAFHRSRPSLGRTVLAWSAVFVYLMTTAGILVSRTMRLGGAWEVGSLWLSVAALPILIPYFARSVVPGSRQLLDGGSPLTWLRLWGWAGALLALPVIGLGIFFLVAMFMDEKGWYPGFAEALFVTLTWAGCVLLPVSSAVLLRGSNVYPKASDQRGHSAPASSLSITGMLVPLVPIVAVGLLTLILETSLSGFLNAYATPDWTSSPFEKMILDYEHEIPALLAAATVIILGALLWRFLLRIQQRLLPEPLAGWQKWLAMTILAGGVIAWLAAPANWLSTHVVGTVVNAASGEPINRVMVVANRPYDPADSPISQTQSGPSGRFHLVVPANARFFNAEPGGVRHGDKLSFTANANGFRTGVADSLLGINYFSLRRAQLNFRLSPVDSMVKQSKSGSDTQSVLQPTAPREGGQVQQ